MAETEIQTKINKKLSHGDDKKQGIIIWNGLLKECSVHCQISYSKWYNIASYFVPLVLPITFTPLIKVQAKLT